MTRRVDVSVVVPTYEGAAYLDECLASIAAQDLGGVEVLVCDDASTDDSVAIASAWSDRIPRLRVEVNERRLGAVGNVNRCLRRARGRWVKPVFQDDLLEPGAIDALRTAARRGIPVVVGGRSYRFEAGVPDWQRDACQHLLDESLTTRFGGGPVTPAQVAEVAARTAAERRPHLNFVGEPVALLLDRRAARRAGGFDARYRQLWDYELVVRLAMRRGLVLLPEPVATFRVHGASETARNLAGSAFSLNVADRLRLLTAYATHPRFRPVREAAARRDPPLDLTALAVGASWAARQVADALPPDERPGAAALLDEVTAALPRGLGAPWPGSFTATRIAVELLHELTDDPDAAVLELFTNQPLAVDLAEAPSPTEHHSEGAAPARAVRTRRWRPVRRGRS